MKISIVTTCLNSAATIRETIDSVLSQRGEFDLEYIITDAGSTDGTVEIIKSYGSQIQFISTPRQNQSTGINIGFAASTGDVLAYLNADDLYEPGALAEVARCFDKQPECRWLYGACRIIDAQGLEIHSWITRYKNLLQRHFNYFLLLTENFICQPAVFLRRELYESYGGFSEQESLVMDYEYWLRIGYENKPIVLPVYLAAFRRTRESKSNQFFLQQFRDDCRVALHYAVRSRDYLAVPLKFINFAKTTLAYSFLYR